MPVDTSAINTILGAYAQGAQIRQRQEAQKFAEQEAIAQQNLRREAFEEETKRHEATLKLQEARDKATNEFRKKQQDMQSAAHKVSMIDAKGRIAEHTLKSGVTPSGYTRKLAGILPDADEVYYKYVSEEDPSFNFVLPSGITHARQVAEQERIKMQPEMEAKSQEAANRANLEAQKLDAQHQSKMLVEDARMKRQAAAEDEKYRRAIGVAQIRSRSAKTPADKAAADADKLLSPEEIESFNRVNPQAGLKYGAKRRDAYGLNPGRKETESMRRDKEFLDQIEEAAMQLQPEVERNKGYFAGAGFGGKVKEFGRKATGDTSPELAKMKAVLGRITAVVGNKFFGASFTGGEDERIKAFVPRETKDQNYEDVKANLDQLIQYTRQTRARLLGGASTPSTIREDRVEGFMNRYGR